MSTVVCSQFSYCESATLCPAGKPHTRYSECLSHHKCTTHINCVEPKRTSKLSLILQGHPFTWGDIVAVHTIGEYTIVEYHPFVYVKGVGVNTINTDISEFYCFIRGENQSVTCESLDSALATCIAYKNESRGSRAGYYFMRMLKGDK